MFRVLESRNKAYKKAIIFGVPVVAIVVFSGLAILKNLSSAVSATDFNAGRIIDDEIFYNKNAMSVQQIQDFLNRQVESCDTWGTKPASEWGRSDITRAQFAKQRWGVDAPFVCINNYHENPNTHETSFEKGGGSFDGGISAAQIIYNAAQEYGINPQVLLVLLKKESSGPLTNDTWPIKKQYTYAMGYACPDSGANYTAACQSSKGGFYNQMTLAAWQLKYYKDHAQDGGYSLHLGWNNIQYSPDPNCGTKRVYIENVATLSLYIYTPYTPNDAALANYPGTSTCGAYGNRNFFMFFNNLFGAATTEKVEVVQSNVAIPQDSYSISTNAGLSFDIENGAVFTNGAPVQIYNANGSGSQHFSFEQQEDGYYVIRNVASGKVLDVSGGQIRNGSRIQLYGYNGSCGQKWSLQKKLNGKFEILSACNGNKALDISGGQIGSNSAKIQLYNRNDTASQEFNITSLSESLNGIFRISNLVSEKVINVKGNNSADGTLANIWNSDLNDNFQQFEISRYGGVFYKIKSVGSGKFLEISENANAKAVRFWQDRQNACEQLWAIFANSDGSYKIRNACSGGFTLDVSGGAVRTNGAQLQGYNANNTDAQKWKIENINLLKKPESQKDNVVANPLNGNHNIVVQTGLALDLSGGSFSNQTRLQIYNKNETSAQIFSLNKESDGYYTIRSKNNKVIDIRGGNISNGSDIQLYDYNGTCAQKWQFSKNENGSYEILSACDSNKALDVAGGKVNSNGTKLQLYTRNYTPSQQWYLKTL